MKLLFRRALRLLYLLHQAGPLPIAAAAACVALAGMSAFQREAAVHQIPLSRMFDLEAASELGRGLEERCVGLDELPTHPAAAFPPQGLALVWHRAVHELASTFC